MDQLRTLPIRLAPLPGESLDSWFDALASRLHVALGDLLSALGLSRPPRTQGRRFHDIRIDWTVLLRPSEIASISTAAGIEARVIEAMTLSRYDGNALLIESATRHVNRRRLWGRATGSRFCPDCLADSDGRWQLSWRLGWSFACTVHRRLLADVCPRCQRGLAVTPSNLGGWGRDTSATLKAVQVSAIGPLLLKASDQLRYRISADTPHHHVPVRRSLSRHQRVPAMFWNAWALRLRPDQSLTLPALRPALSAAMLLAGTRHNLPDAAEILDGVPDGHDTSRILQRLQAHHRWPLILTALTRLADYLDDGNAPIDYHRRRRLDYSALLPEHRWQHICRQTKAAPGGQRRLHFARCLLFEKISGMPAELGPALFAIGKGDIRTHYLNFAACLTAEVAAHLIDVAQDFLAYHGIHDEPVQWQPPTSLLDDLALPGDDPNAIDIDTLHRLVRESRRSITDAAQWLGTTLDVARHVLDEHPAPSTQNRAADKARNILPKELLTHLYVEQRLALQEVADRVGVSRQTATRLCDEYGIARRGRVRLFKAAISRDWLYEQYVNRRRTLPDLAQEIGMSPTNLARWAKTHNIPLRPRGGASHDDARIALTQASTAAPVLRPVLTSAHAWDRLHRFAAAAKHPTIRAAAKALGLHESVLVTQISQLEHALRGQLLTRAHRGRPMQLTPLGKEVIDAVREC